MLLWEPRTSVTLKPQAMGCRVDRPDPTGLAEHDRVRGATVGARISGVLATMADIEEEWPRTVELVYGVQLKNHMTTMHAQLLQHDQHVCNPLFDKLVIFARPLSLPLPLPVSLPQPRTFLHAISRQPIFYHSLAPTE